MESFNTKCSVDEVLNCTQKTKRDESENFQKFIFNLFEKNGILNDLRAYLRGHIVDVLQCTQTGLPPKTKKHFTQRLELSYQAINIVIAEYLLAMEFNYTLSVFVSEIPLPNMVFDFAKTLSETVNNDYTGIRFIDNDVWTIINYLGIKCDSEYASRIVEMYKEKRSPLLLCLLKCMSFNRKEMLGPEDKSSEESLSTVNSSDAEEKLPKCRAKQDKCKHYAFCVTCKKKMQKTKQRYKEKKRVFAKIFEQMKGVYEYELVTVRADEEKKMKKTLANHALILQRKCDEMVSSYKARESELEQNVEEKKKFLWGLARALREQHRHMTRAIACVADESQRLRDAENNLKKQTAEAEKLIKEKGEKMREQISKELVVLSQHLDSMRRERESLDVEKETLQKLLTTHNNIDMKSNYNSLKDEISMLKGYLESIKTKCLVERATTTDCGVGDDVVLNNCCGVQYECAKVGDRIKRSLLVNDFKKRKNVNFVQSKLVEVCPERSLERNISSVCSDGEELRRSKVRVLKEENQRLRTVTRQQRSHIEQLCIERARIQAQMLATSLEPTAPSPLRPATAPVPSDFTSYVDTEEPARKNKCGNLNREKSPKTVLREAKQKLKPKSTDTTRIRRAPSPNCVLREAKLRLRKLEIEAEAVEESYRKYRRRRDEARDPRDKERDSRVLGDTEIKRSRSLNRIHDDNVTKLTTERKVIEKNMEQDMDKYLRDYQTVVNLNEKHFSNKTTSLRNEKPIPKDICDVDDKLYDYLDTPINEFRKLYGTDDSRRTHRKYTAKADDKETHRVQGNNEELKKIDEVEKKIKLSENIKQVESVHGEVKSNVIDENTVNKDVEVELKNFVESNCEDNVPAKIFEQGNVQYITDTPSIEIKTSVEVRNIDTNNTKIKELVEREIDSTNNDVKLLKMNEVNTTKTNNVLRLEIENMNEVNSLKTDNTETVVLVQSSVENVSDTVDVQLSPRMTILVSPKKSSDDAGKCKIVLSQENVKLNTNDDFNGIFNSANVEVVSSVEMQLQLSNEAIDSLSEEKNDYIDDFSADVDADYNTNSGNSPISLAKTSEDENFWDN